MDLGWPRVVRESEHLLICPRRQVSVHEESKISQVKRCQHFGTKLSVVCRENFLKLPLLFFYIFWCYSAWELLQGNVLGETTGGCRDGEESAELGLKATIPLAAAALQMARIPAVYITDYDQDPLQVEPYWEPYYALTV
nr:uncharacterized protein LOC113821543 [Penaeus vannamei]